VAAKATVQKVAVTCGMTIQSVSQVAVGGNSIFVAHERHVWRGQLLRHASGGHEIRLADSVNLAVEVKDVAANLETVVLLLRNNKLAIMGNNLVLLQELSVSLGGRRIAVDSNKNIYVSCGAHIVVIESSGATKTLLQPLPPDDATLRDGPAHSATSGVVSAIACRHNGVEFLDGSAGALRFLCHGSAVIEYIRLGGRLDI